MDQTQSGRLSSHLDALRRPTYPSSSRQRRPQQHATTPSSSSRTLIEPASLSRQASSNPNPCRYESLEETSRAYRTSALRHLHGNGTPKPLSWKARQAAANNPGSGKSSSLASQPVLVRSYSGDPDENSGSSKMPTRRSFLFPGNSSSSSQQRRQPEPEIPAGEEFSIDGILRAIEPNIRSTLNSIGEICGRSKLSLANEYGSHIAPLGEIRAPPGGLLPVEEASSTHEGYSGDNVVIYDDDNPVDGREHSPFSNYTFFDALLPPISVPSQAVHTNDQPREQPAEPIPTTREFASKPKAGGRALLGTTEADDDRVQNILTPALVSEILLDAQANGRLKPDHLSSQMSQANISTQWADPSKPSDVQSLFRWLKQAAWSDSCEGGQQTAESRLRATLERQSEPVSP
ncbi:uncharacterized protein DSM5745_00451 [Aspergillus mulundensis]|uniref:Uncharacterized protein n=1 Tax=Aspergillus mulundensis TaxID=1810919 RepID=A0A3D8T3M9_9EURO|nr:Uncharacterized protein DSM5745_00451 [Aspergillus mulundensis]RDW93129.1 Uncharacterized protein DSM5745_00451 [Aspergillus mulundensis]